MRLQSLPKALCPIALATCAWAIAQETPSEPAPVNDREKQTETVPAPAQEQQSEQPPKPIEEIPAPPATPGDPIDQAPIVPQENIGQPGMDSLPEVGPQPVDEIQGLPTDALLSSSDNNAAAIPADSSTPDVNSILASVLSNNQDVATPTFLSNDREWLRGLGFGGDLSFIYDTNVYQTSGLQKYPKADDFILGFKPFVVYGSEKYGLVYNAKLVVDAEDYFDHDDLSAIGYVASFEGGYEGRKFSSLIDLYMSHQLSIDRDYGGPVERNIFRFDSAFSYKFSRKTSLDANLGYSLDSPETRNFFETSHEYANLAFSWQESPLLKLGGGLGWNRSEGERQATRDGIGPLFRLKYTLSKKVSFEGETGVDYVTYDSGGDDIFWSGKIAAKYVPSKFWAFDLSLLKDSLPDGAVAGSYRDFIGIRAGVEKKIYNATVKLGLGYERNSYVRPGGASVAGLDRDYYTLDLSALYPLYRDHLDLQVFTKFSDEESDSALRKWSGSQYGIALKSKF